ncbi:MAG: translocation/assembly module TamB domain-containing protein [Gemmatimonadaceae bacterium]
MKRRHLVVLVSAFTLLTLIFVAAVTIGVGVGTDPGREQIRSLVEQQVGGRVRGKVHLGRIRGGFLTGFTIDSFAIRDLQDSILVSTGRVKVDYDLRDLFDRRILLRNVEVEHPVIRLRQHPEGDWNHQRIFKSDGPGTPNVPGRSFGDFVVLDSVRVRDAEFTLTRPWSPDDSLTGARRDSAIRVNIANPAREIRRSAEGLIHTYRWSKISGFLPHVRMAHPDSNRFGQLFVVEDLRVEELEPPFSFRNGRGTVRKMGDSVFIDVPHFDLPASTGSAQGKIWWGSGLPMRVDVRVKGDSVSLSDVAWVYETLPRVGSGRTNLRITNDPENLHDFQFALTDMDVRSTNSRVTGAMTFLPGGPVLVIKDVNLRGAPVNFDLVRTFAGEPLPVDWQGDLFGYVRGPGGPLTNWVIEESEVTFRDQHVRGAASQAKGRGALNILDPEMTQFRGFEVDVAYLDTRSIEYLFPSFPRIGGTIHGVATLDSLWLDVRFSKANVIHRNGPGEPTRVTGSGRVTYADDFMKFDVAVNAQPLSLTMMSRAYPLGLKGLMSGPIQARGTSNDLQLTTQLEGLAGRISYSGRVDAYPLSIAARGGGRVDALDLAQLVDKPQTPQGWVTGVYQLDVRGDTNDLGTLRGNASMFVDRAELDGIRVFPSRLRARFADGRMYVDTLRVESVAATITATGALGLTSRRSDSLQYQITVDSLGGLRRYVSQLTSAWAQPAGASADSLSGTVILMGSARGSLEALDVSGQVTGSNVFVRREAGREIAGSFSLSNILAGPTGTASLRFTALDIGGIVLDTLGASVRFDTAKTGAFTLGAEAKNGVTLTARGDLVLARPNASVILRDIALVTDSSHWSLLGPASITQEGRGFAIDSLVLANGRGGRVALAGFAPDTGRARIQFRADSVSLRDVGRIAQLPDSLFGWAQATATGAGTSTAPVMSMRATLKDVRYGGLRLERVNASAEYIDRRAQVALDYTRGGKSALIARGSLPLELKYFGARLLDDTLRGTIRTDSANLDIIEAFVPQLRDATGRLVANIDIGGTWNHPDLTGELRVEDGEVYVDPMGIRMKGVNVDVAMFGHRDSLAIRRLVGWSGATAGDSLSLRGYVSYRDLSNPYLNLRLDARSFHALNKRTLGRLWVSTEPAGMRLRGQLRGATLSGGLVVDRGDIYLPDPELSRKRLVDLSSQFSDSTVLAGVDLPEPPSRIIESLLLDGVRVALGDEVWLRSNEANIKLGGSLNVQRSTDPRADSDSLTYRLALEGVLRAERGTYTLNLLYTIRREFQVEGGTITFFGSSELAPELNISALHLVKRANQPDLKIRVRLTGPLYPRSIVSLESGESYAISQSDLVSFLVFGVPSFALGDQETRTMELALQTLIPSGQALLPGLVGRWIGPVADYLQLRPGTLDARQFFEPDGNGTDAFRSFLFTSRVGTEVQLKGNWFVNVTAGLCQLDPTPENSTNSGLLDAYSVSGKLEYRFSSSASLKVGREPSAAVLNCNKTPQGRAFVPTPSQWGFSLFKSWRF